MNQTGKKSLQNFIWHALPVLAFVLWGLLCITQNLWYDEAYSASMVSLPWKRLLYITAVDDHSPFYYFLLKAFYCLFGSDPHRFFSLKLLSLLFMTGYMLLGKYYVRKLFGQTVSVYFMLFSLLMPIMSVQAGNVRMYATALFFMTLMGLSAYDLYLEPARRKWIVFCAATVCTVYCHTFAMIQAFLFYVLFFAVLLITGKKDLLKGFFASGITTAVLFSPWLLVTVRQMVLRMRYDTGSVTERPTWHSLAGYCAEWFSALETPIIPVVILGLALCIVLSIFAVLWMRKEHNYAPAVAVGALFSTILAGVLISVFINNCFLGRYVFPGFGFLMLFYAVGMSHVHNKGVMAAILLAALLSFGMQYASELRLEYDPGLKDYEQFVEREMTADDVIIGPFTHTIFLNVYHPDLTYYLMGYKLYSLPFVNTEALTEVAQLDDAAGNIWYITFYGDEPDGLADDFTYEEALHFSYMYYDFVLFRLERK